MKKCMIPAALLLTLFFACNDKPADETTTTTTTTSTTDEKVVMPMEMSYSGKIEIGSNANMVKVMQWNKWMGEGNVDSAASLLADSVSIDLSDGTSFNTTADSIKKVLLGWRSAMKTIDIKYIAAMPINNIDKKHEWVLSWTDESYTYNDGKQEHLIIHEDYRMENGKIRQVLQYARKVPPPPPAKAK